MLEGSEADEGKAVPSGEIRSDSRGSKARNDVAGRPREGEERGCSEGYGEK